MTHTFIQALLKQPVARTPIWIMRQAGRYLPAYRATRTRAGDFLTLCKTPELACEVTLQPLEYFDLDAAIIFSDILTIPDAMGLGLHFVENEGPAFHKPITDIHDIKNLPFEHLNEQLTYVFDAIKLTCKHLNNRVPLIGFSGSPWTLACYMLDGRSDKNFHHIKKLIYREPKILHLLLKKLTHAVTQYLYAQMQAGAQAIMIFDSWGGILTTSAYQEFSLNYMQKIIQTLPREINGQIIPTILFTKNGGQWLELIAQTGCNAINVDWQLDMRQARERVGDRVALQGNMDPAVLLGTPENIRTEVQKILQAYGPNPGHIFNLGHGITPDIPPEHVKILVDSVHELSMSYVNPK